MALTSGIAKRRLGEAHSSLHDQVVTELRQAILSGRLKPGERLVEGRLADELGVSRNPVREAIRVLASEGLIEVTARRGAAVATMTEQEARETIELRALLEGQNARLAARRQELTELQAEQPSDSVTITTMKEELEALIATLTARRDALARQLEDASRLGE